MLRQKQKACFFCLLYTFMKKLSLKYRLSILFLLFGIGIVVLYTYLNWKAPLFWSENLLLFGGLGLLLVLIKAGILYSYSKKYEDSLEKQSKQNFQLFEENPTPMWVYDKKTFAFLAVNQAAIAQYGYSREEFLQMSILDIRPPEDREKVIENLTAAQEKFYSSGLWRHFRKDGSQLHVKISSHDMMFNNRPAEIILVSDVTEQVRFEKEREQLLNNLLQQNHQLEEFAYIASHQLRAPVANILGLTNILDMVKEEEVPHIVQRIKESATRLDDTIKKVAFLVEQRKDVNVILEEVDLEVVVQQAMETLSPQIQATNASITYDFQVLPHFFSIRNYIQDIMNNLLSNALKYRKPDQASKICIRSYKKDSVAFISIIDNGLGLDLNKHAVNLGKPFTRFHFHVPGSGIGLSLVKTQLDILNGNIRFHSQPEGGMQVEISLPLRE